MTGAERGCLLLTSHLGNPERRPLTPAQMRTLAQRGADMGLPLDEQELQEQDLADLGYSREMAGRILALLAEEDLLDHYLSRGRKQDCCPVSRVNDRYPKRLRQNLGLDAPGCLWARGDITLLNTPAISLVGSRELLSPNRDFAAAVGEYAASQGLTLVSGNARGADRTAQEAALASGGRVISIVADELRRQPLHEGVLYLSEEDFDAPFTTARALSRNRCIHALGSMVFVAQAGLHRGGTWNGCTLNLRHGWSPVICLRDGSQAVRELEERGAYAIGAEELSGFEAIGKEEITFFDP